jgi:hypothetical protein
MFDFDFFRRRTAKELMQTAEERYVAPIPGPMDKAPVYQIGKTEDGMVTLKMGYTTLTMTNGGVDQLIRILEAAKEPEEDGQPN